MNGLFMNHINILELVKISNSIIHHFYQIFYLNNKYILATLPDMYERTITIGSAGKTFSVTGWKLGWAYGPANLLYNLQIVHQNSIYTCNTPIQVIIELLIEYLSWYNFLELSFLIFKFIFFNFLGGCSYWIRTRIRKIRSTWLLFC